MLWETSDEVDILSRWRGCFGPVRDALYRTMVTGLAKVFDSDKRTISLKNLLRKAKEAPAVLVPRLTVREIEDLEGQISKHDATLNHLKRLRDQHSTPGRGSRSWIATDKVVTWTG